MMSESAEQASKPRTWRPIVLWSAGILLALGLAWFVGRVAAPVWQVHRVMAAHDAAQMPNSPSMVGCSAVERLGGQAAAARKIDLYLRMPDFVASHKRSALEWLFGCGPAGLPPVRRMLNSPDDELRAKAFDVLFTFAVLGKAVEAPGQEKLQDEPLLPLFAEGASDRSARVRTVVARGLRHYEVERTYAGQPPRPEVSRALAALLADPEEEVRFRAADPLGGQAGCFTATNEPDIIAALARALADPSARVRQAASATLGSCGGHARVAIPALGRLSNDPAEGVRAAAAEALKKIRGEKAGK
jgi:HEAT repeat protein